MLSKIDIDMQLIIRLAIITTLGRCNSCPRGRSMFPCVVFRLRVWPTLGQSHYEAVWEI